MAKNKALEEIKEQLDQGIQDVLGLGFQEQSISELLISYSLKVYSSASVNSPVPSLIARIKIGERYV